MFYSRQVFLQINCWIDPQFDLRVEEWGLVQKDTGMHPILMDMPPALAELSGVYIIEWLLILFPPLPLIFFPIMRRVALQNL